MKYLILLISFLSVIGLNAQNAPIDFETGGYGADWTWTCFENDTNLPLEIIANPDPTGENTSSTVAKFTALQTGQPWAGCESMHGSDIGTFVLSTSNSTVKIMVWKSVISDVGIKFSKPDGWSMGEIKVANTVVDAWEELTFDFTSQFQDGYDQIVIFPDFDLNGRTQDNIIYFDNITFSEQVAGETNIALNKPGFASTELQPASLAFDGNMGTRWESEFSDPQWIYVDLEEVYEIHGVNLEWEGAYGIEYLIEISNDATTWTEVFSELNGNGGLDEISFTPINGRYVRMYGTVRGTVYGYSLWEFEVFGTPDPIGLIDVVSSEMNVWPNPASDRLNISFNNTEAHSCKITDLQGRVLSFTELNFQNNVIELGDIKSGIHILSIRNLVTNELVIKKILID